ncbi:TolC family protein [Chryseolinea soli]|nr:TolC family protein [Chryseolinea soli]
MTKTISLFFLLVSLLLCKDLAAQTLSLEECIDAALKNNQQLRNSQLDMAASAFHVKELKSALLPTVDFAGQSLYYKDLPAQYAPSSAFGGPEGEYTKLSLNMRQTASANLQLSQSLFNQSVRTGVKTAQAAQEATRLQDGVVRENVVYNVTATYYSIQVLNDNLERLATNLTNLEHATQINSVLKDNELVSPNAHNRMLINLENLRNQYENQKLLLSKNVTQLKNLMDMDVNDSLAVQPFDYAALLAMPEAADLSQRPDLKLQQAQIKVAQFEKKNIAAGYFPTLTNTLSYGYTGYNNEFGPFTPINNDWVRSSYFALTLKVPVFDGFRKQNQIRQKEMTIQRNINTLAMMRANADKEMEDALSTYRSNKTLWDSNKKSLDLAEKLFASASGEYESGITTLTDLLNAQNDLTNARTNYSNALLNLKLAELSLKKANGTLITKP